jgi:outer membrane biosynthesis protein TonB
MPPITPLDPDQTHTDNASAGPGREAEARRAAAGEVVDTPSDQPVTFIPHAADGSVPSRPTVIRTSRFGELEEHELVRLLDSIEDERARGRFRESIYISLFIWVIILWVLFYGPKYLWHAPQLISPAAALHERELTVLNAPVLPHPAPRLPQKALDSKTLEKLRAMNPRPTPPAPRESAAPPPTPSALPSNPVPAMPAPVNPPPVTTRTPPPIVADAPTPQPSSHPSFSTPSTSDSMRDLAEDAARNRNSGGPTGGRRSGSGGPLNMGGVDVLSPAQPGVDLGPYLRKIIADVYRNWYPLIPEETRPPLSKQGETWIRFTINPDGSIGAMHLDASTHDDSINRSCWGSITSEGQFPDLPKNWHGPLELRFHYLVNKQPE